MGREGKRMEMKENGSSSAPVEINMPDSHTFARARMKARARVRACAHTHTHTFTFMGSTNTAVNRSPTCVHP